MEQSKRENQHLYQRLLVYHCFRDSKSASEAASHLNQTYNDENFVSLQTVEALYGRFEEQSFNFDDLCRLDFAGRIAEETAEEEEEEEEESTLPPSTAEDEQMVVPVTPVVTSSDDLLLDDVELMFDSSEVTVNNNSASAPVDITAPTSAEEEENNSNEPLPELAVVVKRKRGRPPKARKEPEENLIPLQPEPEVVVVTEKRKRGRPPKSAKLVPELEPASASDLAPDQAPASTPTPAPEPAQIEDPETAEELQPKQKIERKKKKAEASFVVPRPSLPREASRPKPKPPKPKGRIRIRKKPSTAEETERAPIDPKIFLPKAIAEGTARPEPLDDTAAGGVLDLLGKLSGKMSDNKRLNLRRRQLYLHCFQAKYSTAEAAKYLCSVYGEGFTSKSGVSGWYRRFRRNEFSLDDRKRPGAPAMIDGEELAGYMAANPDVTVTQLSERYKLHRTTIKKWLTIIGYRYVVDRWQKVVADPRAAGPPPEAALTDRQLVEYRLKYPQATVREVAEHFLVNRGVVACRLRALGFDIPKWPRYAAKRYNSRERRWEYRPLGLHVQPGENVRKRTYKEIKESMERKKAREAAAAAAASGTATSTATDPEENETNSAASADIAATASAADDLMTVPEQLQMLELVQLDAQQQQQQMMMTSTEANFASNINSNVSTLLPAVLRHKTNTSATATSTLNSIISSINSISSNSISNLSNLQQTSALYPPNQSSFSSNHQALIQLNGNGTLGTFEQQNIIVGPPSSASATTYLQTNGQLPYIAAVQQQGQQQQLLQQTNSYESSSSSSFAQQMGLDSAQVQSLLHPYYM
ncbi:hypothetical protein TYRP_009420 [Tyrophagus putrescentiae]|nr:hypothetical protein TYRP_009420 [Tyrophagus putrescentiae]